MATVLLNGARRPKQYVLVTKNRHKHDQLLSHDLAKSMNFLQRWTWKARTGALKSMIPAATTTSETIGSSCRAEALATMRTSLLEMPTASVKMSTVSKPMRAICFMPLAVSMPACAKAVDNA